jgi:hypothetical protein
LPDYIRFPTPEECLKAEKHLSEIETDLEREILLMCLIINVVKPGEVIKIRELTKRLRQHHQEVLDKHGLTAKVTSTLAFFKWLHKPMLKQCIIIDSSNMNDTKSKRKKRREKMKKALDHATVQWNGVTVEKVTEGFDFKDYGLEVFPSEAKLYLPHVSVTAEEAKEHKLSSEQLQKLNEEIMHYYEVS